MKKIQEQELNEVEKTQFVDIRVCTKKRKCGWKGTYPQLLWKRKDEYECNHVFETVVI
jgi:hypothetical protein